MLVRLRLLCLATIVSALAFLIAIPAIAQDVTFDSDVISGLPIRAIGPAAMGGRIADIAAVHEGQRLTIYVGSASGGVWKSVDGGTTFKPIFDKQPSLSIGSVAIDPSNPQTVWVGTGESWVRNSVSVGTGVYRSRDGGENWEAMGLPDSEHVSRIRCASEGQQHGVRVRSRPSLEFEHRARCFQNHRRRQDLEQNFSTGTTAPAARRWRWTRRIPSVLYAAMWDVRREPHNFRSGGPGSGLFKSTDAGATWHELRKGLPEGDLGRIGIAVAPCESRRVYAVVEAKNHTALFRSDDAGDSWAEVNNSFNVSGRPFYFARLAVDPKNPDRVYKPGFFLTVSEDGGKSFSAAFSTTKAPARSVHSDLHALWIDPDNPDQMLLRHRWWRVPVAGSRQPLALSSNNFPVSQFYHVSADMAEPYNVYGGLQDNGTWMGPSRAVDGIANRALAEHRFWRWLLGVLRSRRCGLCLCGIPGRKDRALPQVHRRIEGHQAAAAAG